MRLNTLTPGKGAKKSAKRVGRGIAAGQGKTAGRGVKGQTSRSGGYHKVGFEGGQMPLQRRLPKVGFHSLAARLSAEVRLHELGKVKGDTADLATLKAARLVPKDATRAKVIASGTVERAIKVVGLKVTAGARKAIEAAGGSVE